MLCVQVYMWECRGTDVHLNFVLVLQIDLTTYVVSTIVGTGSQGNDKEGGRIGVDQPICSPWDLALSRSPG